MNWEQHPMRAGGSKWKYILKGESTKLQNERRSQWGKWRNTIIRTFIDIQHTVYSTQYMRNTQSAEMTSQRDGLIGGGSQLLINGKRIGYEGFRVVF